MRRILLLAIPALGDVLLCTPLLTALHAAWPGAETHVLVRKGHAGVLDGNPDVQRVIEVAKHPTLREYAALLHRILRAYDLMLSNSTSDRAAIYALLAARRRVSVIPPPDGKPPWKRWVYDRWTVLDAQHVHTLVQTNRVGQLAGVHAGYEVRLPRAADSEAVLRVLLGDDWRRPPFAVLHPTPALPFKRWHPRGWRGVAEHLRRRGLRVLITSGPSEEEMAYLERTIAFAESSVTSLAGKLRLSDVTTLLEHCSVYVGVDTLVTHMAAAAGAPTVAIFGPTNPVVWGPWPRGCSADRSPWEHRGSQRVRNVSLVQGAGWCVPCSRQGCLDRRDSRSDCLASLGEEKVIAAIDELLGQRIPA